MTSEWKNYRVVCGKGAFDTYKDRETGYDTVTLVEVFNRGPTALDKLKAEWIIPSSYAEPDARNHKAQRERGVFVALTADIDTGNHSADDIDSLVVEFFGEGIAARIYSTSSATADNKKWRVLIPLAKPSPHAGWRRIMHGFYDFMEANGVKMDRTLLRPGQVCYLPNVAPDMRMGGQVTGAPLFYDGGPVDGRGATPEDGLAPEWIARFEAAEAAAEKAREAVRAEAAARAAEKPRDGSIAAWNAANPLADVLLSCGYEPSPSRDDDWRSPKQTSGSYATRLYRREDGTEFWISLSGSDAEADVGAAAAGCRWGDAFDLFVHFKHGGNFTAAVNSLTGSLPQQLAEAIGRLEPTDAYPDPVEQEKAIRKRYDGSGDSGNAGAFADMWQGKLLHVQETNEILQFDKVSGWLNTAGEKTALAASEAVVKRMSSDAWLVTDEALRASLIKRVSGSCSLPRLQAMAKIGFSRPGMWARMADFDTDPLLLGVTNGVLRLDSRELLKPTPGLLVSKRARVAYDPSARCPQFDGFLEEVQPEVDVRRLLQQLAGLCLYGEPGVQQLFFMFGNGANGKSTYMELLAWMLGDYAAAVQTELLMGGRRDSQSASPDLMRLKGARLAYCNETGEGRHLDTNLVKQLTGNDTITARPLHGDFVSFSPSHSLVMTGNHRPIVRETGEGVWRRLLLIGWPVTIPEERRDPDLLAKLKTEGAGILNWALAGLADYSSNARRLRIPISVRESTAGYRSEQDIVGGWLEEEMALVADARIETKLAFEGYKTWAQDNGHRPMSKNSLTRKLEERGIARGGRGQGFYLGIKRREDEAFQHLRPS